MCLPTEIRRRFDLHRMGFSLVEVLVAMAVLCLIVALSATMIGQIQKVWKYTRARTEQFQKARQALGTIASRLSEATLNPYWMVETNSSGTPLRYARQSDLRFLAGPAASLTGFAAPGTGCALFFQAPTGFSSQSPGIFTDALNTWGYFVEYGSDAGYRPPFLASAGVSAQNRFRLLEFTDPCDTLRVFKYTSGDPGYVGHEWFSTTLAMAGNRRVLADNIVALVVLPRLTAAEDPDGVVLSPGFVYDSTATNPHKVLNPRHQLPPIVDVAVVAIDEQSARRINWEATPPDFGSANLFQDPAKLEADLDTLRTAIEAKGMSVGVFRASIPIGAARWSTEQSN
jgi:uncharacterized protein (TIGR02599 family)